MTTALQINDRTNDYHRIVLYYLPPHPSYCAKALTALNSVDYLH